MVKCSQPPCTCELAWQSTAWQSGGVCAVLWCTSQCYSVQGRLWVYVLCCGADRHVARGVQWHRLADWLWVHVCQLDASLAYANLPSQTALFEGQQGRCHVDWVAPCPDDWFCRVVLIV